MIANWAGVVWKKMPWGLRRLIVRATQDAFTVSAAAVITNPAGEVLLLDHHIRPKSGWGLPGGFIEHGEQPEEGVRREVREEVGLELENVSLVRVRTVGAHIEMLFRATTSGTPEVRSREIKGFAWVSGDSLPAGMNRAQKAHVKNALANLQ